MGNVLITAGFAMTTLGQFTFGMYGLVILAKGGGKAEISHWRNHSDSHRSPPYCNWNSVARTPPPISLDAYHICLFNRRSGLEGVYAGISLLFGM